MFRKHFQWNPFFFPDCFWKAFSRNILKPRECTQNVLSLAPKMLTQLQPCLQFKSFSRLSVGRGARSLCMRRGRIVGVTNGICCDSIRQIKCLQGQPTSQTWSPAAADGNKLPAGVNGRRATALIAALAALPLQPELYDTAKSKDILSFGS